MFAFRPFIVNLQRSIALPQIVISFGIEQET
jgi:hypothetical protein